MKKLYISLVTLFLINMVLGQTDQPCLSNGISFTTQSQIDSFQINHPNCTEISGVVGIMGADITNLDSLNVLTSISGSLHIGRNPYGGNPLLINLNGLANLIHIGAGLEIFNNDLLIDLSGLNNLDSIHTNLSIDENNALTNLSGLNNLQFVGDMFYLGGNTALGTLMGLENLTSIGGNLIIQGSPDLLNLTELGNLKFIGGSLNISALHSLKNLYGLDGITSLGGHLAISGNNVLTSINGLDKITTIEGFVSINYNDSLSSLSGIENIEANTIIDLYITFNSILTTCEVNSVCDYLVSPSGTIEIHDNAIGCNSEEEVEEACESASIDEEMHKNSLTIYPNPSSTQITIELITTPQNNTFMTIYNLNGQQLITQPITEPQTVVDVSILPSGVYFIKVADDEKVMMGKVVVE